jgi:hypothetical protein
MNDEQIKQRIAYLVQHGGLYEDPIEDLRGKVRVMFYMCSAACACGVVGLFLLLR